MTVFSDIMHVWNGWLCWQFFTYIVETREKWIFVLMWTSRISCFYKLTCDMFVLRPCNQMSVSLCSLELSEWRGQNQRTLVVGWFPASLTVPSPPPAAAPPVVTPVPSSSYISPPVKGSLQHIGHGDIKPDRSWGTPENLEESVMLLSEIIVFVTFPLIDLTQ